MSSVDRGYGYTRRMLRALALPVALPVALPLALLLGAPAAADDAATLPPIVARSIAFHGGEIYRAAAVDLTLRSKSGDTRIAAVVDGGLFDYTATTGTSTGGERKVRHTNRPDAEPVAEWRDGKPVSLDEEGRRRARDWVQARVYFPFLPFRLADPSARFVDRGVIDWQGRPLHLVEVGFESGSSTGADDEYRYWFDPETGRLEQFAYSFSENEGGLRFRVAEDHRRVGGILVFDQKNYGVDGGDHRIAEITPAFVAHRMQLVSIVSLADLEVRPLR